MFVSELMGILLESDSENCCLIILEGDEADMRQIGEISSPNEICALTLATARYLQGTVQYKKFSNSYQRIDPISLNKAVAIRSGNQVWALGGCPPAEAVGIILFLLFLEKKADASTVCLIMHENPELSHAIAEVFNTFCATMHSTAPSIRH